MVLLNTDTIRSTDTIVIAAGAIPGSCHNYHPLICQEIADSREMFLTEFGFKSHRNGRQSTTQTRTTNHKHNTTIGEQNPHIQTEQQSLPDAHHTADGAEPQTEEISYETAGSSCNWGDRSKDRLPDYNEKVFWEPESDSEDGDARTLLSTAAKIVKDAFSCFLKPKKRNSIKRKQPIPDTPFTKVPKLDPTIQSR